MQKNVYFKLPTCNEYDIYIKHGWLAFAKAITLRIDDVDIINLKLKNKETDTERVFNYFSFFKSC